MADLRDTAPGPGDQGLGEQRVANGGSASPSGEHRSWLHPGVVAAGAAPTERPGIPPDELTLLRPASGPVRLDSPPYVEQLPLDSPGPAPGPEGGHPHTRRPAKRPSNKSPAPTVAVCVLGLVVIGFLVAALFRGTTPAPEPTRRTGTTGGRRVGGAKPPPASAPDLARPPAPGIYRYTATRTSGPGTKPRTDEETTLVRTLAEADQELRQVFVMQFSGGQERSEVAWRADGQHLISTFVPAIGLCTWSPDELVGPHQLAVGAEWSSDSTCGATFRGTPVTLHRVQKTRVTGTRPVTVEDVTADAYSLERNVTLTISARTKAGPRKITQDTATTEALLPPYGLVVSSTSTIKRTDAAGKLTTTTLQRDLKSLKPAAAPPSSPTTAQPPPTSPASTPAGPGGRSVPTAVPRRGSPPPSTAGAPPASPFAPVTPEPAPRQDLAPPPTAPARTAPPRTEPPPQPAPPPPADCNPRIDDC